VLSPAPPDTLGGDEQHAVVVAEDNVGGAHQVRHRDGEAGLQVA